MKKALIRSKSSRFNLFAASVIAISIVVVGYTLYITLAATAVTVEPEAASLDSGGKAKVIDDIAASGGKAVQFAGVLAQNPDPGPAPEGELLWSDAPDSPVGTSHPLQNWQETPWNFYAGTSATVVTDPIKGKAIRFHGPANQSNGDNQRGELVPEFEFDGGEEVWLGFDLWVDSPLGMAGSHQHLWQFKSAPSEGSPTFVVNINNHTEGLVTGNSGTLFASTPYDRWTRLVFYLDVTKGGTSSIEIWQDGQLVVPRYEQSALVRSGDEEGYLKFGIYRSDKATAYDMTMRMANFKIGTTREIVE